MIPTIGENVADASNEGLPFNGINPMSFMGLPMPDVSEAQQGPSRNNNVRRPIRGAMSKPARIQQEQAQYGNSNTVNNNVTSNRNNKEDKRTKATLQALWEEFKPAVLEYRKTGGLDDMQAFLDDWAMGCVDAGVKPDMKARISAIMAVMEILYSKDDPRDVGAAVMMALVSPGLKPNMDVIRNYDPRQDIIIEEDESGDVPPDSSPSTDKDDSGGNTRTE